MKRQFEGASWVSATAETVRPIVFLQMKLALQIAALVFVVSPIHAGELVSFDLVRTSAGALEARMPYAPSTSVRVGDRLELSSDDGYDFGLSVSKTSYSELGNRIIHASTAAGGKAIIVVSNNGTMLGSISEHGQRHQISTTANGLKRIVPEGHSGVEKKVDGLGLAPEQGVPATEIQLELGELETASTRSRIMKNEQSSEVIYPAYKTGTARVSVLIYYDNSLSNPLTTIDYIEQITNEAFADSKAKVEIDIAGAKSVTVNDGASHFDLYNAMNAAEAPFDDIIADRAFFSADVVFLLRGTGWPDDLGCGFAAYGVNKQNHYRSQYEGVVQWLPAGNGAYCSDYLFAHEIGHILGGQHHRADLTDEGGPRYGAYSYSHGHYVAGAVHTIMASGGGIGVGERLYSSPALSCGGYPCGISKSQSDAADNVSTFNSTGHLIASNEGPFAFEAVSTYATRRDESTCTTSDETDGFFRGVYIRNQSAFSVEVLSTHFGRPDGTYRITEHEAKSFTLEPGQTYGWGFCREDGEDPVMGTVYDKAFHRYIHPETGQIVETTTHEWDDSYDGEYRAVRVASGPGGSVSGNTTQSVRVGSAKTFNFTPNNGYVINSIQSNCSGSKSGNSYTVDVGQDNCFVEATFSQVAQSETLRLSIETPAEGQVYSGIGTFQGWAIAQEGIDRVDLYVNDVFFQSAPYGGSRGDVGNVFPDVPNSSNSGYALAFNYSNLSNGRHTLRAVAVTENGRTLERTSEFTVKKFHKPFIGPQDSVNLSGASCSVQGDNISVVDALIDGTAYDISLEWRTGTQGFEIYDIR